MADKKITALNEASSGASEDLLHIIDDPGGSPINKKLTIKNFVSGVVHTTNGTSQTATEKLLDITLNVNAMPTGTDTYDNVRTVSVNTVMNYGTSNPNKAGNLASLEVNTILNHANAYVTGELAGLKVIMDRNAENASSTANGYAMILKVANTVASSTKALTAYIKIEDRAGTSANTSYFMDIPAAYGVTGNSDYGSAFSASTNKTGGTGSGYLKIRIGGVDRFIPLYA
jgi:hypothetical protein